MFGAGIFTTTGFQAADLRHPLFIFALWIVGGGLALLGALCYAELGAMMPEAGGEYVYPARDIRCGARLHERVRLLHWQDSRRRSRPPPKSFVIYLGNFFPFLAEENMLAAGVGVVDVCAIAIVWVLVWIHMRAVRAGTGFNDFMTAFKVAGIVAILLAAVALGQGDASNLVTPFSVLWRSSARSCSPPLGTSLIFVMFTFAGWNAAAYVAGEMENPQRDLPRALLLAAQPPCWFSI